MPDDTADQEQRIEELTERIAELEAENERLREQQQSGQTRRTLLRAAGVAGAGAISLTAATGSVAADPQGVLEGTSAGDPLLRIRANQLVLVERSGAPAAPSSGRVTIYTDSGDL